MARGKGHFEEEPLPEKLNFSVWVDIGRYAFRHWAILLAGVLCTVFVTFYDSSFVPVMNAGAIAAANGLSSTPISSIDELVVPVTFIFGIHVDFGFTSYAITLGAMILLRSLFIFLTFYTTNLLSMHIMTDLRRDCFSKIQNLSFSYFDRNSSGWLISRLQSDTSSIGDILSWSLNNVLWSVFQIIFALLTMFSIHVWMSLVVLASLPFVAFITPLFEKAILKAHRSARNAYSHYVGYLAESIDGAKTVKTLGIEDNVYEEAEEITEDVRAKRLYAGKLNAGYIPLLSLTSQVMTAVVMFVGLAWIGDPSFAVNAALVVLFLSFVGSIYDPISSIAEVMTEFMAAQAGAEKVMGLLKEKIEIADTEEVIAKYGTVLQPKLEAYEPFKGDITYENVSFHYQTGPEVIFPLSLTIKEGTSVALVGETGSGKTTLVNLLCRFYEPTGGRILIDGKDYKERSLGWLRSNIGYVQQSPFVWNGTYFENIAYGKPGATLEEVRAAAKLVGIDDFIMDSKDGYDTYLRDGGGMLSQGQKQLISFARAILRDPRVLILDEATSSIDTETEAEVQKALNVLLKGRTSIVIAHRLSTIVNSDRILFLEHGVIVEDGNHQQLMAKKGKYHALYMTQFQQLSVGEQIDRYEKEPVKATK
ncbi:MAG: ABC transporter ATP-binding protein [Bacilli bacterium]|nr:ABC transporter ATP-binding protein [Bacilli bacterium]